MAHGFGEQVRYLRKHLRIICSVGILAVCLSWVGVEPAIAGPPTEAMKGTIDEVLRILANKEFKQPSKVEERRSLLEKVIGDRFDYEELTERALGKHWKGVSPDQRKEVVDLFRSLLIKTYANRIESYSGEGVQYLRERVEHIEGKEHAEVLTKILSEKSALRADYQLIHKAGDWRVYDVKIEDVSLVRNFRSQFDRVIEKSSFAGLLEELREKSGKFKAP